MAGYSFLPSFLRHNRVNPPNLKTRKFALLQTVSIHEFESAEGGPKVVGSMTLFIHFTKEFGQRINRIGTLGYALRWRNG